MHVLLSVGSDSRNWFTDRAHYKQSVRWSHTSSSAVMRMANPKDHNRMPNTRNKFLNLSCMFYSLLVQVAVTDSLMMHNSHELCWIRTYFFDCSAQHGQPAIQRYLQFHLDFLDDDHHDSWTLWLVKQDQASHPWVVPYDWVLARWTGDVSGDAASIGRHQRERGHP